MPLPTTTYYVAIKEGEKVTKLKIDGEDVTSWIEEEAIRLYTKNKDAQFYNKSHTNSNPLYGQAYWQDPSCRCTKALTGNLSIHIVEKNT